MNQPHTIISVTRENYTASISSADGDSPIAIEAVCMFAAVLLADGFDIGALCDAMEQYANAYKPKDHQ